MVHSRNSVKRFEATALFNNDILLSIAPFLDCSELANLALTCRGFGSKMDHDWSLVEKVARQMINRSQTEEERDALPRYDGESWIALLYELQMLRSLLTFDQLIGDRIEYVCGDRSCVTSSNDDGQNFTEEWSGTPQTAICSNHIMRSGKHYAAFRITGSTRFCSYFWPGVVRPIHGWDEEGLRMFSFWDSNYFAALRGEWTDQWGESNVNCCMYNSFEGTCTWGDWQASTRHKVEWSGMQSLCMEDGTIGLLLDLDEGTLTVYKDGRRLGVMKDGKSCDRSLDFLLHIICVNS